MTVTETFAVRLRFLREERGLSQSQLADSLGVSRGSISFYENGERTPDITFLVGVKEFFRVDLDYLLGYAEESYPNGKQINEIDDYSLLPQYAQARIDAVRDRMAAVARKYIPAQGDDPHTLFDCIHADAMAVISAYEHLEEALQKGEAHQWSALEQFKQDLNRSSEVKMVRYLYERQFHLRGNTVETYQKTQPTEPSRPGRKRK